MAVFISFHIVYPLTVAFNIGLCTNLIKTLLFIMIIQLFSCKIELLLDGSQINVHVMFPAMKT